ncbi:TetR family transcriptional regulator [Streptomyces sp. 3MP-14]|uniref:TetR family transcriptional regulator n=1 Tax=Streptomyces mimosae TaxID=2586635 RepID=A0A5N6A0S4_9ACTN|nr:MULTISPECIES: ScbR family autoregulator-binding transcription factor [Streptomyces]KAB8161599.1 TetR family transcriptional regulator [Streptomyces mimosae]KAB8173464.1 TetR family transcriptional regulator [Streptomyces sp. 3MP-14]
MQQRSARTLRRLVDSAASEFDRGGYARTTLDDITRAAGVTKGALYHHFSSRDALADAVQISCRDLLEDLLDLARAREPSPLQLVVDVTHSLNRLLHHESVVRASVRIARERAQVPPPPYDFYRLWLGQTRTLLQEAQKRDELAEGLSDTASQALVTSVTAGVEVLWWDGTPYSESADRLTAVWDLLLPLIARGETGQRLRTAPPEEVGV